MRVNTRFSIVSNHLPFFSGQTRDSDIDTDCQSLDHKRFKPVSHMPLYFASALKETLPKRMSFLDLFRISHDKVGCFVVAPADAMAKIEACGLVQKTIFKI